MVRARETTSNPALGSSVPVHEWMVVCWRKNFPGLDNLQKDDDGEPMKNWWPFLFY